MASSSRSDTGPAERFYRRCRSGLARRFSIDARGLAAFRIAIAIVLLVDLFHRAGDLRAFYTDSGVLPRTLLFEQYPAMARLSVHALSGGAAMQAALFALAAVCALSLLVGYRTRLAALLSFLLLISLHARNPLVLNGADRMLRQLLLFGLLLPLGRRWSIDARRRVEERNDDEPIATLATALILVHVVGIFTHNAILKLRGELWLRGDAVRYAFDQGHYTTPIGEALLALPALLVVVNWAWLGLLVCSVLLVVLVGRARFALVLSFVGASLGMALTMTVGLFPLVVIAAMLLFVPPSMWDGVERDRVGNVFARDRTEVRSGGLRTLASRAYSIVQAKDGSRGATRIARNRRETHLRTVRAAVSTARRGASRLTPVVASGLLVFLLVANSAALGYVDASERTDSLDPEAYDWSMFAPDPAETYGWFAIEAELEDGDRVGAFGDRTVENDSERPPDAGGAYPNFRWRGYVTGAVDGDSRDRLAAYTCRRVGDRYETGVESVRIRYIERSVRLDGDGEVRSTEFEPRECPPDPDRARSE